jgi:glycosyltransferase involved in cell wall biosynthesis
MSGRAPRRLLTIGHSYVVATNRRLAHEMARQGGPEWAVTAVAPRRYRGDLRRVDVEPIPQEADTLQALPVALDRWPHFMRYRGLDAVLRSDWDLVHCWEEPYVYAAAQVARFAPRTSRVVFASFQNIPKRYPWPLSAFERTSMARADGWIAFGETVHRALNGLPLYASRASRVIAAGVDTSLFRPDCAAARAVRAQIGWRERDLVVGFVGRFVPQKGLFTLLNALRGSGADWRALFVGGGPLEPELRRFAERNSGRVHIAANVAHADVPRWINAMTVLCAPSRTTIRWREQFGRMLIEAMACGVPVVASDSGEMPFVIGDAGTVLPEHDVSAWTAAIDRLLHDDELRRERSAAGRARVEERFAWPIIAKAHLAFFSELLDGTR